MLAATRSIGENVLLGYGAVDFVPYATLERSRQTRPLLRDSPSAPHMPATLRTSLLVALVLAGGFQPAVAQRPLPPDSVVHALIRRRVDEGRSVGIAMGLIDANGRTRSLAYGRGTPGTSLDERWRSERHPLCRAAQGG